MIPSDTSNDFKQELIWQVIKSIPYGRVATYGQIAALAGLPGLARFVGRTLKQLPEGSKLPWHRVINAQGRISFPINSQRYLTQYELLINENIVFKKDKINLRQYLWEI